MAELIGKPAPNFVATAVIRQEFSKVSLKDSCGRFVVLFFYPMDFSRVCSSEIVRISEKIDEFKQRNCKFIGVSCDSEFSHLAWIKQLATEKELVDINIPLVADKSGRIAREYGIYNEDQGVSNRAFFLIDHEQVVRFISINDRPVERSVEEILRLLDVLQCENKDEMNVPMTRGLKRRVSEEGGNEAPMKKALTLSEGEGAMLN
ncbi:peroxiredoxin-2-like [Thrips palmi]|uniref:thioredoxin-dependent peroxiredoxin n=1 Tax=Thrips palmi TaxID=161013 RepID=A0A6P8Y7X5_THRPL|nr:peroxiredoxin-2-like [Thrips palmi]XP_034232181.1 peroxiredoxin-2-like [Thrips palmi]